MVVDESIAYGQATPFFRILLGHAQVMAYVLVDVTATQVPVSEAPCNLGRGRRVTHRLKRRNQCPMRCQATSPVDLLVRQF